MWHTPKPFIECYFQRGGSIIKFYYNYAGLSEREDAFYTGNFSTDEFKRGVTEFKHLGKRMVLRGHECSLTLTPIIEFGYLIEENQQQNQKPNETSLLMLMKKFNLFFKEDWRGFGGLDIRDIPLTKLDSLLKKEGIREDLNVDY